MTTEHVLGAASSLVIALAAFLVRAAADLTIDACGAVIPSLCGTREARLAAAHRRIQQAGAAGDGVGLSGDDDGGEEARRFGQEGGGPPTALGGAGSGGGGGGDRAQGEGNNELDQYFIV